jgi:hypothetical protein
MINNVRRDCMIISFLSSSLENSIILRTLNDEECSINDIVEKSAQDLVALGMSVDVFTRSINLLLSQLDTLGLIQVKDGVNKMFKLTSDGERIYSKLEIPLKHVISVAGGE